MFTCYSPALRYEFIIVSRFPVSETDKCPPLCFCVSRCILFLGETALITDLGQCGMALRHPPSSCNYRHRHRCTASISSVTMIPTTRPTSSFASLRIVRLCLSNCQHPIVASGYANTNQVPSTVSCRVNPIGRYIVYLLNNRFSIDLCSLENEETDRRDVIKGFCLVGRRKRT